MVRRLWAPDSGDIIWLQFSPQAGHEQAGHRPALVLSPVSYNRRTGLAVCVPMTMQVKGYPFEVAVGNGGVALADQVKSIDWRARKAQRKGAATADELAEVRTLLGTLLALP